MTEPVPIRASSWGDLFDCAYRFEGTQLLGMTKPTSGRAHLGTALHRAAASVDLATMNEAPYPLPDVSDLFHEAFKRPDYEVDWRYEDVPAYKLESVGLQLIHTYAADWSPRFDFLAVEKQIGPIEIPTSSGVTIAITGRMDRSRIVLNEGVQMGTPFDIPPNKQIVDIKTGKRAIVHGIANTKGHAAQLGAYELIEEMATGEPCATSAEVIGMKTAGTPQIASGTIRNAKQLLLGEDGLIEMAGKMLQAGLFPPNPRSMLCDPHYCARWDKCKYHD